MSYNRVTRLFFLRVSLVSLVIFTSLVPAGGENTVSEAQKDIAQEQKPCQFSIFQIPQLIREQQVLDVQVLQLCQDKQFDKAEQLLAAAIGKHPDQAANFYNLACVQAIAGKTEPALDSLEKAVEKGFLQVAHLKSDPDLEQLHKTDRFNLIVAKAENLAAVPPKPQRQVAPRPVKEGVALVDESNTGWDERHGLFMVFHAFDQPEPPALEIVKGSDPVQELLRGWQKQGTAAGLYGILYDNYDRGHSSLSSDNFPQLTRVKYCPQAKASQLDTGLQAMFLHNQPTFGNSSTAVTEGAFWRSQPRLAMINAQTINLMCSQYFANHLYFYPEHRDYDPGHNGKDGGYGDVYPANIPYVIISQGSSGSDKSFMQAVAHTLAAFTPETRAVLVRNGILMPTLQLVFRSSNKTVKQTEDYLTGVAHPTVFASQELNVLSMVTMAHNMKPSEMPPVVQLEVIEEDKPVLGVDYFDAGPREELFTTPCAIARLVRTTKYTRRMLVSAEKSRDVNGQPLTFHWAVLCGNSQAIQIKPINEKQSVVELSISYHERQPILPGSKMESNRVDIGVFVHNGVYYSAPAFVTFYYYDNEKRVYNQDKLIESVEYKSEKNGGNYVDPAIDVFRDWRDDYHYDKKNQLIGWTRSRGQNREEFTADGAIVTEKDKQGRPIKAQTVRYVAKEASDANSASVLEQLLGDEILEYSYASAEDRVGRIASRQKRP